MKGLCSAEHIPDMTDDSEPNLRPTSAQDAELALWRAKALEAMPYFPPILFSLRVLDEPGRRTLGQKGILPAKLRLPDGRTTEWYFDRLRPKLSSNAAAESAGKPYAGCGSGAGAAPAPGEIDGVGAGAAQGAGDVERELVRINTAAAIRQHAEQRGRGSVPGGLLQEAEQVLSPPKVPWQQVLAPAIRRAVASRAGHYDVDLSRRHRRRHRVDIAPGIRIVYPGTCSPTPTLVLIRDTSGSVSDTELQRYTSEVVGIATGMGIRGRDLRIMDVDAAVQHAADYTGATGLTRVHGRGGTDMRDGAGGGRRAGTGVGGHRGSRTRLRVIGPWAIPPPTPHQRS